MRTNSTNERSLKAVVFDVGGVLLDWDPRHLYRKLIADPAQMEWFPANVCTPQWHEQHDRGLSTAESCAALAQEWPQYAGLILAWSERGEEMVARPLPNGVKLLRRFGLDAAATLFVDDCAVNVSAAADVGMQAMVYRGPEPVLARLGLPAS